MSPAEKIWVRVGGGLESVPERLRHGPADIDFPPPGPPLKPLVLNGRLVGWGARAGLGQARKCAEMGQQLTADRRDHLLARLGHKLRSSVLALQESARQAAFGRTELLEGVFEQAQEVGRRAAALEAAAMEPKDGARGVVLGAVLNLALPSVRRNLPPGAAVMGSEPMLVEAFARAHDWLDGDSLTIAAEPVGSWWRIHLATSGLRKGQPVPEMGEPLLRVIIDLHLGGWLDVLPDGADIYLPAYRQP